MITGFEVDRCPFCGRNQASLHLMQLRSMSQCYVRCICGACGPDGSDAESAVKRWNERKGKGVVMPEAIDKCFAALAAPPRNCDVGTAEEQRRRYDEWRNHDELRAALGKDEFEWAQMPYEEGGAE